MFCLRLRFLDVQTNPGQRRPVPAVCWILCSNVRGLAGNLGDLTVASSQYDILLCSETLVSDMRHVTELGFPWFGRPVLLCRGKMSRTRGMDALVRDGYGAFRQPNLIVVVAKCLFLGLWCETDRIFYCLLSSMAAVWVNPYLFPFCGWFEWSSSGVVGFYDHERSWSCSLLLGNCLLLSSVGCRPNPCTWWDTWPPDDLCSWPCMGCCCCTDRFRAGFRPRRVRGHLR